MNSSSYPAQRLTRRHAVRLLAGSAVAVAGVAHLAPESVGAARVWCRADPTFRVNGLVGNVYVSGQLDRAYDTTGPIELTFTVPTDAEVELLAVDPGFGFGYSIEIAYDPTLKIDDSRIGLMVDVRVPSKTDDLPILVEFVPDGTVKLADKKKGKTNESIRVKTEFGKK